MKATFARAVLACSVAVALPSLSEEDKPYRLRQEFTGSHIPKTAAAWSLPLDKRYEDFTPEERAKLHSYYPNLKPGDEPPFPVRGLRPVMREIIELQQQAQEHGEAEYGVRVDAKGQAQAIAVYKSPDERFTKAIAYYLVNTDYKPAKCDGKPCEGEFKFRFDFSVRN